MKLEKFLQESEQKCKREPSFTTPPTFNSKDLKELEDELYSCDEFKDVVRINFIEMPSYLVDVETEEPIAGKRDFLGGNTKTKTVQKYIFEVGEEIKFGKIVDIYSISTSKEYNLNFLSDFDQRKPGVWILPTIYNTETFAPLKEIRVIWSPEQMQDVLALTNSEESPEDRLMRLFQEALLKGESNLPYNSRITIRCSERSIIGKVPAPNIINQPPPSPSYKGFSDSVE